MAFQISKGVIAGAVKVLVYGVAGVGKTTFASKFPKPLFIDLDRGSEKLDVERVSGIKTWPDMVATLTEIAETLHRGEEFPYQTVVIDTADKAAEMCTRHICSRDGKKNIEDYGYGKGYAILSNSFSTDLLVWTQAIVDAGVNVVIVGHAMQRQAVNPDTAEAYDHWELKLPGKNANSIGALVKEWADMVLFAYQTTDVINKDGKKVARNLKRMMRTQTSPFADAKTRFDLPEVLPFSYDEIAQYIPAGGKKDGILEAAQKKKAAAKKATQPKGDKSPTREALNTLMSKGCSNSDFEPITVNELLEAIRQIDKEKADVKDLSELNDEYLKTIIEAWGYTRQYIHNNIRVPF